MTKTQRTTRKLTLIALTLTAFWVSFERCHEFYVKHAPVGSIGDCYAIRYAVSNELWQMKILNNDIENNSSFVELQPLNVDNSTVEVIYTFEQQRALNPKKVECK